MDRVDLEKSIIYTLVYYDVLGGYPLTAFEIYKYLNFLKKEFIEKPDFNEILSILDSNKTISQYHGFYFYKKNSNCVKDRIERQKIADKKWKKTIRIVKILQIIPYTRGIAVSGSLAINNAGSASDLDLMVVSKNGRIWTVRALLNIILQIIGCRRHGQKIKDRICLNWFVTDKSLELQLKNLSRAHFCAQLTPLWGDAFDIFANNNQWVGDYLPFFGIFDSNEHLKKINKNKFLRAVAETVEFFLDSILGDCIEDWLSILQKNKISRKVNPAYLSSTLSEMRNNRWAHLCLSDEALVFHYPISKNLELEKEYFSKIKDP
ncbi:MAG: hypothetical protein ABH887_00830 [bacterium]